MQICKQREVKCIFLILVSFPSLNRLKLRGDASASEFQHAAYDDSWANPSGCKNHSIFQSNYASLVQKLNFQIEIESSCEFLIQCHM